MKTFIISMDTAHGRARLAKLRQQCEAEGIGDIEHVVGVDPNRLPAEVMTRQVAPLCRAFCSPGMIGCGVSHMRCWRAVVDQNLPMALILEDDAVLLPNFRDNMLALLEAAPKDFHILLLGCFLCKMEKFKGTNKVRKIKGFAGTHAYVVSQEGARFLVENVPQVKKHIDIQLSRMTPGVRIYGPPLNLAVQNGDWTSSNLDLGFPGTLNRVLGTIRDGDNMSLAHKFNSASFRIGTMKHNIVITRMLGLLFLVGLVGVPWKVMALYSMVDIGMYPPSSARDPVVKLSAYGLGLAIHTYIRRKLR